MRRCSACSIEFSGSLSRCPLCHGELSGEPAPSAFPRIIVTKPKTMAQTVLSFATLICLAVILIAGLTDSLSIDAIATACVALLVNYLFVRNIILHSPNFLRTTVRYFFVLLAVAGIWFLLTENTAVTTFLMPAICFTAIAFDTVLIIVFKGLFVTDYAKYLLFDVVLALVPLALAIGGLTTSIVPALFSAGAAALFLLAMVVFTRSQLISEVRKLFSA